MSKDINSCLAKVSSSFGWLYKWVWSNHCPCLCMMIQVYWVVGISILLYGAETLIIYWQQIRQLKCFYQWCLQMKLNSGGRTMLQMMLSLWEQTCKALQTFSFSCNYTGVGMWPGRKTPWCPKLFHLVNSVWGSKILVPLGSFKKTNWSSSSHSLTLTSRGSSYSLQTGMPSMHALEMHARPSRVCWVVQIWREEDVRSGPETRENQHHIWVSHAQSPIESALPASEDFMMGINWVC